MMMDWCERADLITLLRVGCVGTVEIMPDLLDYST